MKQRFYNPSILKRFWILAWPTVIYALLETGVGMVDIYFAGFIGPEAVAAIGFSRQIFLVLLIGTLSITTGTITMVSQYYGAHKYESASVVAYHSFLLSILAGIVFGLLGFLLARPSLVLMGAEDEVLRFGAGYLQILLGGVIFLLINFCTNAIFRALGDSKTPLKIAALINLLNILFNYMFMFGFWLIPPFGVSGLAIGTILARLIGSILSLRILTDRNRIVRLHYGATLQFSIFRQLIRIGLPSGVSGFVRNGARILFFRLIAGTAAGTAAVAAATIGFQFRLLAIMPSLAFQVAASALVGQSIGAKKLKEAEAYGWTSIQFCSLIMAFLSLLVFLFPTTIMQWFTDNLKVIALGQTALRFIALEQFCNSVSIVASGALSGAGDTKPAMHYTILSQWIIMIPLAAVLSFYTSLDIMGAWIAWGFAPVIQAILTIIRFKRGKWKEIKAAV
jgi:putative MATE family efflux protein